MTTERADFHVHYDPLNEESAYSVLREAKERGVVALSLLTRGQYSDKAKELISLGRELDVLVIPGLELLVQLDEQVVELISMGFDTDSECIHEAFGQEARMKRNILLAARQRRLLESKGFVVEGFDNNDRLLLEKVMSGYVQEKAKSFCDIVARDPRNVSLMNQEKSFFPGVWKTVQVKYSQVFEKAGVAALDSKFLWVSFFAPGREGYFGVPLSATEVIRIVHSANGVVLYSPEGKFDYTIWNKLLDLDVDGVMGWHGSTLEICPDLVLSTRKRGLLVLGGSDYDPCKNHWQVGVGDGLMYISPRRINDLNQYFKRHEKKT